MENSFCLLVSTFSIILLAYSGIEIVLVWGNVFLSDVKQTLKKTFRGMNCFLLCHCSSADSVWIVINGGGVCR